MISEIKAVHDDAFNCFEESVVAVAVWKGFNYELMFSESWGFDFNPTGSDMCTNLGDRVDRCSSNFINLAAKYSGMSLHHFNYIDTSLSSIKEEIAAMHPVLVNVDSYWVPWTEAYQSYPSSHSCLAVGMDENNLYLTDPYYSKHCQPLPIEYCTKSIKSYETFDYFDQDVINLCWQEIISKSIVKMNKSRYFPNSFSAMRGFGEYISNIKDIDKDIPGLKSNLWKTTLWYNLDALRRGRRQYVKVLQYLARKYDVADLLTASKSMEHIATSWSIVMSLFCKMSYSEKLEGFFNRISSKITAISIEEENICNYLLKITEGSIHIPDKKTESHKYQNQVSSIDFIDLSAYYCNNAISHLFSINCSADFTGTGQYFLASELPADSIWEVENIKFRFPEIVEGLNDNVSCQAQTIPLPGNIYSAIMVLGCGEWGNFSENMILQFEDGETKAIALEFTDWHFPPIYGEAIAWEGRNVDKTRDAVWFNNLSSHIFAQSYAIECKKKIVSITLPDCPNIHIFAISMGK